MLSVIEHFTGRRGGVLDRTLCLERFRFDEPAARRFHEVGQYERPKAHGMVRLIETSPLVQVSHAELVNWLYPPP